MVSGAAAAWRSQEGTTGVNCNSMQRAEMTHPARDAPKRL
jgi:hypothetical protein